MDVGFGKSVKTNLSFYLLICIVQKLVSSAKGITDTEVVRQEAAVDI